MNYTISMLAKLSGVSIRTLHYYDQIGLLKPAYISQSGYRYYQKELGFSLKQIKKILQQAEADRTKALLSQRNLLQDKIKHIKTLIETIDRTIGHLEGKCALSSQELFKGFEPESEQQKKYEKYVENYLIGKYRYKKAQDVLATINKNVKKWAQKEWEQIGQELDSICKELVNLIEKGKQPGNQEVQSIIANHYAFIKKFWTPSKETYAGHADFIIGTDLKNFYNTYHSHLAQFISNAIKIFAERNL